jgi:hypothetical protein
MVFPSQDIEFPITPGEGSESYLEAEDLRLDELERTSVDLDETLAGLGVYIMLVSYVHYLVSFRSRTREPCSGRRQ